MKKFTFEYLGNYHNHGQDAEQSIRLRLTGEICKADNVEHSKGTDCLSYQIKSARATVCKGTDLKAYLDMDASKEFIYGCNDGTAYIMNRAEYESFVKAFGTVTTDSRANGGGAKIRLKSESKAMREWLERA